MTAPWVRRLSDEKYDTNSHTTLSETCAEHLVLETRERNYVRSAVPLHLCVSLTYKNLSPTYPQRHVPYPLSAWPHLFRGAGHEKRRREQLKWSLAFTLYIGSFPCAQLPGPVHTARLGRVCFCVCIFSLGWCFACLFVLFVSLGSYSSWR